MNEIKVNHHFEWWIGACDEFRESMELLGWHICGCSVGKGCHWGEFYAFDETLPIIKELAEKRTVIVTNNREFYIQPATSPLGESINSKFFFSISRNKNK